MNIKTIEDDIVAKIVALINDNTIKVAGYPEDASKYKDFAQAASILVQYGGSDYDEPDPNSTKKINQVRTVNWIITFLFRGLKTHDGAYAHLQTVRKGLTEYVIGTQSGSAVTYSSMMFPVSDRFISEEGGIWEYEAIYRHRLEETKDN